MLFRQLFDRESSTYTYLIADLDSKEAILIDPVLERVERDLQQLKELGFTLKYCLETHIHADRFTGTAKLRELTNCQGIVPEFIELMANLNLPDPQRMAAAIPANEHCGNLTSVNLSIKL